MKIVKTYAILNEGNVADNFATYYQELKTVPENYIEVTSEVTDYEFKKYENGQWSEEKFVPEHAQIELTRMERLEQEDLNNKEAIADLYIMNMMGV